MSCRPFEWQAVMDTTIPCRSPICFCVMLLHITVTHIQFRQCLNQGPFHPQLHFGLFLSNPSVFYCCKPSLTRLYHPPTHPSIHSSIHPSIHPPIQCHTFCIKKERMPIYCIYLLLLCANYKTGEDRFCFFLTSILFFINSRHKCSKFSTSNFTIL